MRQPLLALWALVASPLLGWAIAAAGAGLAALVVLPPALAAVGALAARSSPGRIAAWAAGALAATIALVVIALAVSPDAWH